MQKANKAQTVAQKKRAQGAIEYLLIISAAIIIVAIVIASMVNTIQLGENQGNAAASGYNSKLTDLDKMKKSIFIKVNLQAGDNTISLPNEVSAQELPIVFLYAPKGTQVSFSGETYEKDSEAPPLPAEDAMQTPLNGKVQKLFFDEAQKWLKVNPDGSKTPITGEPKIPCGAEIVVTMSSGYTLPIRKNSVNGPCINYDGNSNSEGGTQTDPISMNIAMQMTLPSTSSLPGGGAQNEILFANQNIFFNFKLINAPAGIDTPFCELDFGGVIINTNSSNGTANIGQTGSQPDVWEGKFSYIPQDPTNGHPSKTVPWNIKCTYSDDSTTTSSYQYLIVYPELYLESASYSPGNIETALAHLDINYFKKSNYDALYLVKMDPTNRILLDFVSTNAICTPDDWRKNFALATRPSEKNPNDPVFTEISCKDANNNFVPTETIGSSNVAICKISGVNYDYNLSRFDITTCSNSVPVTNFND